MSKQEHKKATFAGGCFWCMQPPFDELDGVLSSKVGYTGGQSQNPTYEEVCSGGTDHLEAIEVIYDPTRVSYKALLDAFWRNIDPTDAYGQFADKGTQYQTAIFYHDEQQKSSAEKSKNDLEKEKKFVHPIATVIRPAVSFYAAEGYHQCYYKKSPTHYNAYKVGSGRARFLQEFWAQK